MKHHKKKVKAIKKIKRNPLRRMKYIPRDVKRMINANCVKTLTCQGCGLILKRRINLQPDEDIITVDYKCEKCGWSSSGYTLPYPKKVKKLVRDSSPFGVKTWRGIKFSCPKCNSNRLKLIIRPESIGPESITGSTVTVNYKCKRCGWGAMYALSIVREREMK